MIVTKRELTITQRVRVDAHPQSVPKVLATSGYKRADVLVQIVRMITLVHLHLSVVDTHPVSLANIVTDPLVDAVNLVVQIVQDAAVAVAVIQKAQMLRVVDVILLRKSNIVKKVSEGALSALAALVAKDQAR